VVTKTGDLLGRHLKGGNNYFIMPDSRDSQDCLRVHVVALSFRFFLVVQSVLYKTR